MFDKQSQEKMIKRILSSAKKKVTRYDLVVVQAIIQANHNYKQTQYINTFPAAHATKFLCDVDNSSSIWHWNSHFWCVDLSGLYFWLPAIEVYSNYVEVGTAKLVRNVEDPNLHSLHIGFSLAFSELESRWIAWTVGKVSITILFYK